ncbi:MAG: hypothetical protein PHI63_04505 [Patescibacteria group bacterium]|nr:hypothetical protein [Patescibacteria group bacterium]
MTTTATRAARKSPPSTTRPRIATVIIHDFLALRDGRKFKVRGLGALNAGIHANVCTFLERRGVPTTFRERSGNYSFEIDVVSSLPFTVTMRTHATGFYAVRHPGPKPNARLEGLAFECFYHGSAGRPDALFSPAGDGWILHDCQQRVSSTSVLGFVPRGQLAVAGWTINDEVFYSMRDRAEQVFLLLADAWRAHGVQFTALALQFGFTPDTRILRINGIVDNHCWRIWRDGHHTSDMGLRSYDDIRTFSRLNRQTALASTRWVAEAARRFLSND